MRARLIVSMVMRVLVIDRKRVREVNSDGDAVLLQTGGRRLWPSVC